MIAKANDVLEFWFHPDNAEKQFIKDEHFDNEIRQKFGETWEAGCRGELYHWRSSLKGRLAEIIVLDQFSRNLGRNTVLAFSQDLAALFLAQELLKQEGFTEEFNELEKNFAYLPFMHSESRHIHEIALKLFQDLANEQVIEIEQQHKQIIDRFGRYPHRNQALGRESSVEELAFLEEPNSSF